MKAFVRQSEDSCLIDVYAGQCDTSEVRDILASTLIIDTDKTPNVPIACAYVDAYDEPLLTYNPILLMQDVSGRIDLIGSFEEAELELDRINEAISNLRQYYKDIKQAVARAKENFPGGYQAADEAGQKGE